MGFVHNTPKLEIHLGKLEHNARLEVEILAKYGVTVMGVNKVFNGMPETAQAIINGGITTIAEARIANLKKLQHLDCSKCLLRTPTLSEIEDTVLFADLSLCSDLITIRALSKEAVRQNKAHQLLLMIDMGDLREGIWFEDYTEIVATVREAMALPHLSIYGIGTNFSCYGMVIPTIEHLNLFVALVERIESELKFKFNYLSGGNCTSYHLIHQGVWNPRINHLRIGGLHQFGIEYVDMKYVNGFFHSEKDCKLALSNLYLLKAEIIQVFTKPTMPFGTLGVDAFLQKKTFVDRGRRKQALLSFGKVDIDYRNCAPQDDSIMILGQTSDHTLIDIEEAVYDYKAGEQVIFEVDYTGLLSLCAQNEIEKNFIQGRS
ncbi:MAG: alanine/ornithine racemase family PLP-dependent enzyme [Oligoflexia bacterium]|nr:alanine/ornithine racemase family PLP-dependent enzyme [Oligoflexia bacterium]